MRAWWEIIGWWAVLVLTWLATLNTFSIQELICATVLGLPCAVAARLGRRASAGHWKPRGDWAHWLLSLPYTVVRDTVKALALAVPAQQPDQDAFEELTFGKKETENPRRCAREALATIVLSATPGSVIVDGNAKHDRLLVHSVPIGRTSLQRRVTQ